MPQLQGAASTQPRRLLRVLFLRLGEMPADSGAARVLPVAPSSRRHLILDSPRLSCAGCLRHWARECLSVRVLPFPEQTSFYLEDNLIRDTGFRRLYYADVDYLQIREEHPLHRFCASMRKWRHTCKARLFRPYATSTRPRERCRGSGRFHWRDSEKQQGDIGNARCLESRHLLGLFSGHGTAPKQHCGEPQ